DIGSRRFRVTRLTDGTAVQRRTPALIYRVIDSAPAPIEELELSIEPLTVLVLKARQPEVRRVERLSARRDREPRALGAVLRGDDDDAVRASTPEGGRCLRRRQNDDRGDVGKIEIGDRAAVVESPGAESRRRRREHGIVDRQSIDDEQRLIRTEDRSRS